ncbi:MAG: thiamine pyrophosphate-binding protein, partial [Rhodospirillaceae bacterium]|nr:thiamine pyrophosphate-binding protein [Rhodospirillaceae bacterium]
TTYKAKGVLPEDDPLAIGGAGLSPKADTVVLPLLQRSDCIVLAGYDPIEMRVGWRNPWPADAPVIEFSAVAATHGMHAARHSFVGNVAAGLAALGSGLAPHPVWPDGLAAASREALRAKFAAGGEWGPAQAFATVRAVLPADTIATADSGAHRILLSQMWSCPAPRTLLQSSGLCTMGCALPLGMGAKLAAPERPVVVFVGDAGLEMVLGELATLRDLGLPLIVVVLVDRSLALIEMKQRRSGLANRGVDFEGTDFSAVAAAFGGVGAVADSAATLTEALDGALHRNKFTLISCVIGRRAYDGTF